MNKVMIIGRLGKDLEIKKANNGKSVIEFSLADSKKINGEERTTWINCIAWDARAETLNKYVHKGDKVYVEGEYRKDRYELNGEIRYRTYVLVNGFELLPNPKREEAQNEYSNGTTYINEFGDLPFND